MRPVRTEPYPIFQTKRRFDESQAEVQGWKVGNGPVRTGLILLILCPYLHIVFFVECYLMPCSNGYDDGDNNQMLEIDMELTRPVLSI